MTAKGFKKNPAELDEPDPIANPDFSGSVTSNPKEFRSDGGAGLKRAEPRAPRLRKWSNLVILAGLCVLSSGALFILREVGQEPASDHVVRFPSRAADDSALNDYLKNERYILFKPNRIWHMSEVIAPGYYTLIVLSADWCAPCRPLRFKLNELSKKNSNLVIVDIDVSSAKRMDHFSAKPFEVTSSNLQLPAAFLFDPYGVYINSQSTPNSVGAPITGEENIMSRVSYFFDKRDRKEIIAELEDTSFMAQLIRLKETTGHYANVSAGIIGKTERGALDSSSPEP